jgi:hypothetical protein
MTRIEELEAELTRLRTFGKSIIQNEMDRTAECIRLRDVNGELTNRLKEVDYILLGSNPHQTPAYLFEIILAALTKVRDTLDSVAPDLKLVSAPKASAAITLLDGSSMSRDP